MRVEDFVARREQSWRELEDGIRRARRGRLRGMPAQDLERFGMLYRRAAGDLAIAARDFPDQPVSEYLNSLLTRAHPLLFRGPSPRLSRVVRFYAVELPRAVRSAHVYLYASLGLFALGAVAGWLTVVLRPDLVSSLVPPQVLDGLSQGHLGNDQLKQFAPALAAFIIQNNIMVSLIALVAGVGFGLPTAAILATNGWTLGTLGAAVHQAGFDAGFWSLIVPHGAIEISVILIAGAAGLMIGDSLLRPGLLRRMDSLTRAAQRALVLAVGAAPLLVIAGMIESFVTPSDAAVGAKLAVGAVTGVLMWSWLLLAGRRGSDAAKARARKRAGARPSLDIPGAPAWSPSDAA
ncbi:MAG TPA: stage II sporulation protein M [Candidatus Angelobacter sp.]|jgi:uncharacterized membrane protein SpoIIM required for sporulation|nr:stage II sporulation protein M [Candidatus Angelobacter sp.]